MRKIIILPIFLLIIGCSSILAQRTNTPRQDRAGSPPATRNTNNTRVRNDRANTTERRNNTMQRTENRSATRENQADTERRRSPRLGKILRGLELSDEQRSQTKQILKEAKENDTPGKEVLRQINSILNEKQSKQFIKKIKRIKNKKNEDGENSTPSDGDNSNP